MPDYLPEPKKGDDSRELWRNVRELLRITKRQDSELRRLSSGVTDLRLAPNFKEGGGGGPTNIRQMRVKEVGEDKLTCIAWAGAVLGGSLDEPDPTDSLDGHFEVPVAKPWRLRRTPFHGRTVVIPLEYSPFRMTVLYNYLGASARSAINTASGAVEKQYIVPRYVAGDVIYVGTADATGLDGVNLIDINADGRAWSAHLTDP